MGITLDNRKRPAHGIAVNPVCPPRLFLPVSNPVKVGIPAVQDVSPADNPTFGDGGEASGGI